jgi:hypothetical protein
LRLGWQLPSTHKSLGVRSYIILSNHLIQLRNGACCRTAQDVWQEFQIITAVAAVQVLGTFAKLPAIAAATAAGDGNSNAASAEAVAAGALADPASGATAAAAAEGANSGGSSSTSVAAAAAADDEQDPGAAHQAIVLLPSSKLSGKAQRAIKWGRSLQLLQCSNAMSALAGVQQKAREVLTACGIRGLASSTAWQARICALDANIAPGSSSSSSGSSSGSSSSSKAALPQESAAPEDISNVFTDCLQLCKALVAAAPLPMTCNNPYCDNLAGASEAAAAMKLCAGCRCRYCSAACQAADRRRHKHACRKVAAAGLAYRQDRVSGVSDDSPCLG